jgi:lipopolysaccharide transport system ATP-binding protein
MSSLEPGLAADRCAIRTIGLTKRYRLYQKPAYRLLDLFGLCPATRDFYSEHVALNDVDLTINSGEKVAIIGRNGAGKSTLLKCIAGLVRPTSGTADVYGKVSNLLQIGSGFHPDFTGRQNVYAALAHQGITGEAARLLFDEILAFAEVEEYIDQPMKTYSTGMCSRLMFASSVIVKPEILIVDEILGVGDAYFAHKSFERMRQLCSHDGTTLLLVTHDIYSALGLCDRFVWIDRGAVKFDGTGKDAISLYESSIKEQEEQSLRQQNVARLSAAESVVHVMVRSQTGFALPAPVALQTIELGLDNGTTMTLPVATGAAGWTLVPEGNLGPAETVEGEECRVLRTSGSIYHKAEWVVQLPPSSHIVGGRVRWHYKGDEPVGVRIFTPTRKLLVGGSLHGGTGWQETALTRDDQSASDLDLLKQTDYGTGLVRITGVEFLDRDGGPVVAAKHGEPLTVRIGVRIAPSLKSRDVTLVLGFARHGSPYSAYVSDDRLSLGDAEHSVIEVTIDTVKLGSGQWYVNLGIGEPGLFHRATLKYFTLDPSWYHLLAARIELQVVSSGPLDASGCFVVLPAHVSVRAAAEPEAISTEVVQ